MKTYYRLGTFFIITGLALLLLFVISILAGGFQGIYLLLSLPALILGFLILRNKPSTESGRFGTLRRIQENNRRRGEGGMGMGRGRRGRVSEDNEECDNGEDSDE